MYIEKDQECITLPANSKMELILRRMNIVLYERKGKWTGDRAGTKKSHEICTAFALSSNNIIYCHTELMWEVVCASLRQA